MTCAIVFGAALAACVRASSPARESETVAVSPVAGAKLNVDPTDASAVSAITRRDASDIEGRVLDAITVHSAHERTITREGINLLMDHANALMGSVDTQSVLSDGGAVIGVRLVGIRAGSVVAKLGFENGDRLEAVNGRSLTVAHMMELYANIREATEFDVDVIRRGKPAKVIVHVR